MTCSSVALCLLGIISAQFGDLSAIVVLYLTYTVLQCGSLLSCCAVCSLNSQISPLFPLPAMLRANVLTIIMHCYQMCTVSIRQKCTFLAKHNKVWTTIISRCFQGAPATRCRSYNKTRQLPVYIDQHWTLMTPTFSTEHSSRSSTSSLTPVLCLLPSLPSSLLH